MGVYDYGRDEMNEFSMIRRDDQIHQARKKMTSRQTAQRKDNSSTSETHRKVRENMNDDTHRIGKKYMTDSKLIVLPSIIP